LKRLVVNADDFGFTADVNEGIVEAHQRGILTSTTLMANGDAFDDAVRLASRNPALDVGCHLVLIGGRSTLPPYNPLPASVPHLLGWIVSRRIAIYDELAAQVRKILAAGFSPTHLDTHKHTHLAPPVLDAVARVAQEFGIPWVRRPFQIPFLRSRFHRVLADRHCRTTDHFVGFQLTGRFRAPELVQLIHHLPDGTTEFMCHPGHCRAELRNAATRLKESREQELLALISPEARQALANSQVQLVNYRVLSECGKMGLS
jgi:chitin disaccharide deacetylase